MLCERMLAGTDFGATVMNEIENGLDVIMVRVYLTEGEKLLKQTLAYLHDEHRVQGVTVFRGIAGFGRSGVMHSSTLLDLTMDLPLVVEFFDEPEKVSLIIKHLKTLLEPEHIVFWSAQTAV